MKMMFLGLNINYIKMMCCEYINDIFINHINNNLLDEEISYSIYPKMVLLNYLDRINQKNISHNPSKVFYYIDDKLYIEEAGRIFWLNEEIFHEYKFTDPYELEKYCSDILCIVFNKPYVITYIISKITLNNMGHSVNPDTFKKIPHKINLQSVK
jgi:hypothetical protein